MAYISEPFVVKGMEVNNRIVMPPMCQFSALAKDGMPNEWHYVHYVSRAAGGTGLIIIEMTDVEPDGRITDYDLGIWSDAHVPAFARIVKEAQKYGAKVGIQIGHAGRKAQHVETPLAPSDLPPLDSPYPAKALTLEQTEAMVQKFQDGVRRAVEAGVDTVELHGAHGYLIHQFHSRLTNHREDVYGQDLARFGVEVIQAAREVMPADMPLLMRVSAIEYADGGYDLDHMLDICAKYRDAGVDVFHISTGGEGLPAGKRKPGNYPGYQIPFAREIKQALGVPVIAVGMIDDPKLAEATVASGDADLVAIGRAMLQDPYWALHALRDLGEQAGLIRPYAGEGW